MNACLAAMIGLSLLPTSTPGTKPGRWYSAVVQWRHGKEAAPWERLLKVPGGGGDLYRVALQPLWAVEGGILAIEIVVALPSEPNKNLLGERQLNVPAPYVLTVEELLAGLETSQFGRSRTFKLPRPSKGILRVSVTGSTLGRGIGICPGCPNIQGLDATLEIEASE